MILITWNIQWCRGCDGRVDPERIVRVARSMADFDVLCLQEVADNFAGLPGSSGEDQFRAIAGLLPGFTAVEGVAVDSADPRSGTPRRRRFGNLLLTRLPVLSAFRHLLPWPPDPQFAGMQRVAVEAVLDAASGPMRVTTTHLEYYSARQRAAQVERLRDLHAEACGHRSDTVGAEKAGGPFEPMARPPSGILTADFNFRSSDPEYARLQAPIAHDVPAYVDAWTLAHPGRAHDHTIGVHDRVQWPAPFACDFVFVTQDLAPRVQEVRVNLETDASDHQPVMLVLA